MKEFFAAIGVAAVIIIGYSVIKNKVGKKEKSGCGCGGNYGSGNEHNHNGEIDDEDCGCQGNYTETQQTQMALVVPMNNSYCNQNGLGENWIKDYDTNMNFFTNKGIIN